jgi:ATP-binding cassette, subfamily F, member 3
MLEIADLTHRIAGRPLFDGASAFLADGWKVGLIGRNGSGKSTLISLIREAATRGDGSIRIKRGARTGFVAQEIAPTDTPLIEVVLAADEERAALMAEAETAHDANRIADIHTRLADIDAWGAEARASAILVGLGFGQGDLTRAAREFSGGWRMRAALAGVLFSTPDLLVLDEPTNYLDLEGAAWLEAFLRKYPSTVLVVSHDREMLNRSVTHILALENQKLEVHAGGYDNYLRKRAERTANLAAQKAKQDVEREHLQAFVDRFRAKASKARQAQSRIKMLERMKEISVPLADRTTPFRFEDPGELASPLIQLEEADLGYVEGRPVLKKVSFRLDHDDRIVIIGPNGQGKTTLVKSIGARLALLAGKRRASSSVKTGYFSQDQLDELRVGETPLDHVREIAPNLTPAAQRSLAAQMGFGAQKIDTPVQNLSGGEKVRLLLGLMAYRKPHVLILDEPTSHLDIDSREALIVALNDFPGAILLITHDVYLAEAVADRLWLVHNGRASQYDGDLADYRKLVLDADRPVDQAERDPHHHAPAPAVAAAPRSKKPGTFGLKQRVTAAEAALEAATRELAELDRAIAAPGLFEANPTKGRALAAQRKVVAAQLEKAEEEWLAASAALEGAGP